MTLKLCNEVDGSGARPISALPGIARHRQHLLSLAEQLEVEFGMGIFYSLVLTTAMGRRPSAPRGHRAALWRLRTEAWLLRAECSALKWVLLTKQRLLK